MSEEGKKNSIGNFGGIANLIDVIDYDTAPIDIEDNLGGTGPDGSQEEKGKKQLEDIPDNNENYLEIDDGQKENEDEESDEDKIKDVDSEKIPSGQAKESPPSSANDDKYKLFAQELVSEGLLDEFTDEQWNEFIKDGYKTKGLVNLFNKKIKSIEDAYENSLTDEDREIYQGKKLGVPLDEIGNLNNFLTTLNNISDDSLESDIDTQKELVKILYKRTSKLTDVKIDKIIQGLEDSGELYDESKSSREELKTLVSEEKINVINSKKEREQEIINNQNKERETLKNTIDTLEEIIPGYKITEVAKKEIYDLMTKPVGKDSNGKYINKANFLRNKNPVKFDILFNYYIQMGLFDSDTKGNFKPDINKLTKPIKTKMSKSAFDKAMEKEVPTSGTFTSNVKSRQISDIFDI